MIVEPEEMPSFQRDATVLLRELTTGKADVAFQLLPIIYDELHRLATYQMRRERGDHTLQATALVHEAYLKLVGQSANWQSRAHFFAVAAQLMRRILIDHARSHLRHKRGGDQQIVSLDEAVVFSPEKSEYLIKVDEALQRLTKLDPRQGKIVELRFFAGLTIEETAEALNISSKTVKREWSVAKAWLHGELKPSHGAIA